MGETAQGRKPARPQWWITWASGPLLLASGCAEHAATAELRATAPPIPTGQARIWFYRPWEPSESFNLANIDVNERYSGSVANGNAFYRDVPPGHYHIAPQSYGRDFNQDKDIELGAGQQVYVKIVSLRVWELGVGGDESNFDRDTFYAWLMPAEVAQAEIARNRAGI